MRRLPEIATNVLWSWDHQLRALFRRLDPVLWRECHNPVLMLSRLKPELLQRASNDARYLAVYQRACERFDAYMLAPPSYNDGRLIAYFSMEYGLAECMPIYSGGLGVLSGDHMKSSSDENYPLVGVGLLYQKGYFQQSLNSDGWQQERTPINDFYQLPVLPVFQADGSELLVTVKLPAGPVWIKVWQMMVGRVKLYLMDTNIPQNEATGYRDITDQLYGGDAIMRIRQEIVLGIGGLRALKALGLKPNVFHMNEGHSAFMPLERIRLLIEEEKLSFAEAFEATRASNIFTTHTSVPAGIDLFDGGLVFEYLSAYCDEAKIPIDQLFALGRMHPGDSSERYSMAILAMKASAYRNAVSILHGDVSKEMWADLWPGLPVSEVPITSVTNGIHLPTMLYGELAMLYDQYLQPDWRECYTDPRIWNDVKDIPSRELWEVHRKQKRQMVQFVRDRSVRAAERRNASAPELRRLEQVLDPDAFTIGFARRFATYKRATLIFRDVARLKKLLNSKDRPVQIIIAGKAHPKDHPGKTLIREIVQLSRDPELSQHLVFVEDYSLQVAREMVQGVDLWLNNPRRGEEACGTSGMKAAINGVPNLSILDGWWDEAYEPGLGFALGDRDIYEPGQDEFHASGIYSILENEILPMYFQRGDDGLPAEWLERVRSCIQKISPQFNAQRMIQEYMHRLYEPAYHASLEFSKNQYAGARSRAHWASKVQAAWDRLRFVDQGPRPKNLMTSGQPIPFRVVVDLAGLEASDVRVEALVGAIRPDGTLEESEVVLLKPAGDNQGLSVFEASYLPRLTGRLGYALRISPNYFIDPLTRPCGDLIRWA
ncbi:alpha-glucan family phosphorylase [Bryobacter aggregatus]|uniref:alpha-glucan family phosphorylase n=1 Tax=Bryobacter aggregatus TaxID=360054 RepID=UPI001EE195A8|nr:alpha-glucan family phosphorylase [Bryobacter aggregatus]